ncbi:hypothetical protein [Pseudomonas sp. H9]|uniref:hypothetical protein n=1 Tax=Pseudomonas sp. H9 TaxID=483968 RepID=UPI0010580742|nr:hypothetical protein [Pseudomonas sp. H9]TDF81200.1 hypothetical protein E1573_18445 [Pseudomonas sp. H9]
MSNMKFKDISRVVFNAYVNEVCLDIALRNKFLASEPAASFLPRYKMMVVLPYYKKYPCLISLGLWVAIVTLLPLLFVASVFFTLLGVLYASFRRLPRYVDLEEEISFPVSNNFKLYNYLFSDFDRRQRFLCRGTFAFVKYFSVVDFTRAFFVVQGVLWRCLIRRYDKDIRFRDVALHMRDLISISCFAIFVAKLDFYGKRPITDSNLQRWDFIISHLAPHSSLIQHAFIHGDIEFEAPFGRLGKLYVFDQLFVEVFSRYFSIEQIGKVAPKINMYPCSTSKPTLFLASSEPYLDIEIEFLRFVKGNFDYYVLVKLHPKHIYGEKVNALTEMADELVGRSDFPDSDYMASYDSFLGYEYKSLGKRVLFLKEGWSLSTISS